MRSLGGENGTTEVTATIAVLAIFGIPLPILTLCLALLGIAMSGMALVKLNRLVDVIDEQNKQQAEAIKADTPPGGAKGDP